VKRLTLSLACFAYDRTAALFDGRASVDGCDLVGTILEPEEAFHRAFRTRDFDVTEISTSSHMMMVSRGASTHVGIPATLSRVFRHSGIYVRTDRIKAPADLRGKRVGVPEYQITANVWIRGLLQDEYGIHPREIHWRRGGIEEPGRGERAPIQLPADIDLKQIPGDRTLSGMLESGELDAMIGARAPSSFLRGAPHVGRLFPNYREVEEDYFRRTGIFPIMHVVGIRRELAEAHPWLPLNVYKGFLQAKRIAEKYLDEINFLAVMHPWIVAEHARLKELMGDDYWPYGLQGNRRTLEALCRYSFEQGLSARLVAPEELFDPGTRELSKI
jgi:4,5-dihydroxyphthalate decarboxylase